VRFFVRLYRNDAAGLAPSKEFLCKMTEKMQADAPPSRQAGFVRCCLKTRKFPLLSVNRLCNLCRDGFWYPEKDYHKSAVELIIFIQNQLFANYALLLLRAI
ncbi:MAG: hypothetical protein IKI58_01395, partial [Oscillospiraceae bacterium]|nr:hypothetical protein [Oscillospiraceae bacterium]